MDRAFLRTERRLLCVLFALLVSTTACRMDATPSEGIDPQAEAAADPEGRVRIGDVLWYVDYDAALEVAREQDKALWVHFGENPG